MNHKVTQEERKKEISRQILWYNPHFTGRLNMDLGRQFFMSASLLATIYDAFSIAKLLTFHIAAFQVLVYRLQGLTGQNKSPQGQCRMSNVIHQTKVTSDNAQVETCTGLTAGRIRERIQRHSLSFRNRAHCTKTELSKQI